MGPMTNHQWRLASCNLASSSHRPPPGAWPRQRLPSRSVGSVRSQRRRNRQACVSVAAGKSYYDILGVDRGADLKTIKKAYKKKALKLHPDVNKEPNAKELFMECKTAYQTLADEKQRRQYDRNFDGGRGGFDWGSFGDAFQGATSSSSSQQRKKRPEEEFYGFSDFFNDLGRNVSSGMGQIQSLFRDLERELNERQRKPSSGQPKSLWQELYDVGEEFVEFLEQEVAGVEKKTQKNKTSADSTTKSAGEQARSQAEAAAAKAAEEAEKAKASAEQAKQNAESEIDDMLAELKRNLKK